MLLCLALAHPLAAAPQEIYVETRRLLPPIQSQGLYEGFTDAAHGDVDGDGDVDIVLSRWSGNRLWLNGGTGRFEEAADALPLRTDTRTVLLEDFDGDGDPDLFQADTDAGRVLGNDGTGAFTLASRTPTTTRRVSSGDVDGDGYTDLLLASSVGLALLRNTGAGLDFALDGTALPPGPGTFAAALVDLDGDGDLDAFGSSKQYFNDGTGHFSPAVAFSTPRMGSVSFADLDGDGDLDGYGSLGGFFYGTDTFLFNDGLGGLTDTSSGWRSSGSAPLDVDADGDVDLLLVAGNHSFVLNDGSGAFSGGSSFAPQGQAHIEGPVVLADLDGDLDLDLVSDGKWLWFRAASTFVEAYPLPVHTAGEQIPVVNAGTLITFADLDGDGAPEVLSAPTTGGPKVLRNDGTGQFEDATASLVSETFKLVREITPVDVDGDLDLDVILARYEDFSPLFRNDGTGKLTADVTAVPDLAGATKGFEPGDLDGDGAVDLIRSGLTTVVLENDGVGTFQTGATLHTGSGLEFPGPPLLLDIAGDGDLDVLFTGSTTNPTSVLTNDGSGAFQPATGLLPAGVQGQDGDVGDLNGDGFDDAAIVVYEAAGLSAHGGAQLLLGAASGVFQDAGVLRGPWQTTLDLQLLDLDADGDLDVYHGGLVDGVAGPWMVFTNDGSGGFAYDPAYEHYSAYPAFADVDGDGDLDALGIRFGEPELRTRVADGQVVWREPARIGYPLPMEVYGDPGSAYVLGVSPGTGQVSLPPYGTLLLDPGLIWLPAFGTVPASGVAVASVPLANDPTLVGQNFFWQALTGLVPTLTNVERTLVGDY